MITLHENPEINTEKWRLPQPQPVRIGIGHFNNNWEGSYLLGNEAEAEEDIVFTLQHQSIGLNKSALGKH